MEGRELVRASLSERSQATVRLCWSFLLLGWSPSEMAGQLGVSAPQLIDALDQLREELQGR